MSEERIIIDIDDSQLDSVLARLNTVSAVAKSTTGSSRLDLKLPTINREMRVILGQLPGMRQVIQGIFLARREMRGFAKGGFGGVSFWMATVANVLILLREIGVMRRRLEREQREFERFVMQSRRFTKQEIQREQVLWKYYLKGQPS